MAQFNRRQGVIATAETDFTTPAVGIIATTTSEVEAASGPTTAVLQIYRGGDTSAALTVSYAVVAPDVTFVDASAFGGTLPSGTVSLAAGQTAADLPITLSQDIGAVASETLEVQITAPSPAQVIGTTAQVQIVNGAPVPGPAPSLAFELVNDLEQIPFIPAHSHRR